MKLKICSVIICLILSLCFLASGCLSSYESSDLLSNDTSVSSQTASSGENPDNSSQSEVESSQNANSNSGSTSSSSENSRVSNPSTIKIPAYSGKAYAVINNNVPFFASSDITDKSFESYSALDSLGRCSTAVASVGRDIMPTEDRGSIGQVKPTGWHTVKYDIVDGKYLYNRCHLIGFQLTGENANTKNLITGTRYFNVDGMLPFEDMVADCVKDTGLHVMYRVTPVFVGKNLVASGVLMEAKSVEDNGNRICFNVFVYNIQPGISINYLTGESSLGTPKISGMTVTLNKNTAIGSSSSNSQSTGSSSSNPSNTSSKVTSSSAQSQTTPTTKPYVLNTNTKKFHLPTCRHVSSMKDSNREDYCGTRAAVINRGYEACKTCKP